MDPYLNTVKRKRLTFRDKRDILNKVKSGSKTKDDIRTEYGISASCLNRMISQENEIIVCTSSNEYEWKNKKSKVSCKNKQLDNALYIWFSQKRNMGEPINGPVLREKAIELNQKLDGPSSFKASNGWLDKFKQRHAIRQLGIKDEKLSSDNEAMFLRNYIDEKGFHMNNVYNADESGIYWKSLPKNDEFKAPIWEETEDRVTTLFCANASGTHKLPLFVIGKDENPNCLINVTCLPVIYKIQENAWMDQTLFIDWYTNNFIPLVLKNQVENGTTGKVLLILDNAPAHPRAEELNSIHRNFEVIYLPPNVTTILQPLCQGIITNTKKLYKRAILRKFLLQEDDGKLEDIIHCMNLLDFFKMFSTAWIELKESTMRNVWKSLLEGVNDDITIKNEDSNDYIEDITERILIKDVDRNINTWLNNDNGNQGWEPLSDDNIVTMVFNEEPAFVAVKMEYSQEEAENYFDCLDEKEEEITAKEAHESFKKGYKWLQKQTECTQSDLRTLNKLCNLAAKKKQSAHS